MIIMVMIMIMIIVIMLILDVGGHDDDDGEDGSPVFRTYMLRFGTLYNILTDC